MSKYADIEKIKEVIRTEWCKYMPSDLDINLSFVLGKISEVPTIEVSDKTECDNCIWNVCNYNKIDLEVSEDCISKEWMLDTLFDYYKEAKNIGELYYGVSEEIQNAPSVIPKMKGVYDD